MYGSLLSTVKEWWNNKKITDTFYVFPNEKVTEWDTPNIYIVALIKAFNDCWWKNIVIVSVITSLLHSDVYRKDDL